jgi:hypothetical protein
MPTTPPILSTGARVELFFAVVLVALFLYAQDDLAAWLTPQVPAVQMSALGTCREPTEHEVVLIAYVKRDGKVVRDGCTYAGSQSAYPKKPRPKIAHAHAHD